MMIQILMSTYNGEQYIRTQLDSIANQDFQEKALLIRDDGSTDGTLEIIREYAKKYSWISFYQGNNIGVQRSFLDLIAKSDLNADYVALSDQDDRWLPTKLSSAIKCLERKDKRIPLLYCSDVNYVGSQLEPLNISVKRVVKNTSFGNALVQNVCTGCTMVMNRSLVQLLNKCSPIDSKEIIMHDWWIYLVASCFGSICFDLKSFIDYRQHGHNVSMAITSKKRLLLYRLQQLVKPRGQIYRQIDNFERSFKNELQEENKIVEEKMIHTILRSEHSMLYRVRIVFDRRYFRQKRLDDLIFRGILLIGKL